MKASFAVALTALAVLLAPRSAAAQDARPTAESIRQLFAAMHIRSILDDVMGQVNASARNSLTQAL